MLDADHKAGNPCLRQQELSLLQSASNVEALEVGYTVCMAYAVQVWRYRIKILMSGLAYHLYGGRQA
jgi:hypothetical protein